MTGKAESEYTKVSHHPQDARTSPKGSAQGYSMFCCAWEWSVHCKMGQARAPLNWDKMATTSIGVLSQIRLEKMSDSNKVFLKLLFLSTHPSLLLLDISNKILGIMAKQLVKTTA